MDKRTVKRNRPIATLLQWFTERRKGKVTESRNGMQDRFNGQSWNDQKKILMAFLQSIKSDREWAYRKISYYWDDSFIPLVKELWETYHEWQCALPIILHFPISYLQENIDSFSKGRRYFYLCKRFAESKTPFTIDKEKLNPEDLISIKQMMNEPITDAEALETFFFVIRSMFVDNLQGYHNHRKKKGLLPVFTGSDYISYPHPFIFSDIPYFQILSHQLTQAGCDKAVREFHKWDCAVSDRVQRSEEYFKLHERLTERKTDPITYSLILTDIVKAYTYKMIPGIFKSESDHFNYRPYTFAIVNLSPPEFSFVSDYNSDTLQEILNGKTEKPDNYVNPIMSEQQLCQIKEENPDFEKLINKFSLKIDDMTKGE